MHDTWDFLSFLPRALSHHQGAGHCHCPITPLVISGSVIAFNLHTRRFDSRDSCVCFPDEKTSPGRSDINNTLFSISSTNADWFLQETSFWVDLAWTCHAKVTCAWEIPNIYTHDVYLSFLWGALIFQCPQLLWGPPKRTNTFTPLGPPLILVIWWWCSLQR